MQKKESKITTKPTKRKVNVGSSLTSKETSKLRDGVFVYTGQLSVNELSEKINIPVTQIIKYFFMQGKMITINHLLDDELIGEICLNFGLDFKKEQIVDEVDIEDYHLVDDEKSLKERPPVVTIMGHVDHGKTTLIDTIRNSRVAAGEFGGISQAIGAYQKEIHGKKITFIDTPGHEAFSAMRGRGASVTDIVVLVVAADDGVMPQTIEAIEHAKAAKVPIIVAVNKMDKPGANPKKIKDQLVNYDVVAEEFGGDILFQEISAKFKTGIDLLLENILALAEMLELKANPNRYAVGTVLESVLDKGVGPKATLLVENGTLKSNDFVVVGTAYGKVRRMTDEYNKVLKTATPSTPVSIIGLSDLPSAGEKFMAFDNEKQAKDIATKRQIRKDEEYRSSTARSIEDLNTRIMAGEIQELNIIIKADNSGSTEAIKAGIEKMVIPGVSIRILRAGTGAIIDSDIDLAKTGSAIIYGFNVRPMGTVGNRALQEGVEIRLHRVIYALFDEIEAASKGLLKPIEKEEETAKAEVRQIFKVGKVGTILGLMVTSGTLHVSNNVRIVRSGVVVFDGKIKSMKRFQDDIKEASSGFDCGIILQGFNDVNEGDVLEAYKVIEVKR